MTREAAMSPPPSQPLSLRPDQRRECSRSAELGIRCALPADSVTGLCQRHSPEHAEARQHQARTAARVSHATRALKLFGPAWSDPDFSTAETRIAFREAVAGARGRGELDDKAAATLLNACDGAMKDDPVARGSGKPALAPVIVEVTRYGHPGSEAGPEPPP